MLAALEAVARDRIVVRFRRGRDVDDRDVRVVDDVLVVQRRGRRLPELFDLGEPVRLDVAQVQLVDQRGARQRLRAQTADPANADATDFNTLHGTLPRFFFVARRTLSGRWAKQKARARGVFAPSNLRSSLFGG